MGRLLALCALVLVLVPAFAAAVSMGHRHAHAKARAARGQALSAAQSESLVELDALMGARTGVGAGVGAGVGGGDDEDDNDATKDKAPVPPAIPAKIEILKDEEKFPPNQPGAPKAPALAPGPGEKPAPALQSGRFVQTGLRGDDEDDDAEGPAKTESKAVADGEDDDADADADEGEGEGGEGKGKGKKKELTDEEKEKRAAAKNKLPFAGGPKAFPHQRPLPARGALKPPLSCPPRWLHTVVKIDNKLYVFGGVAAYSHKFWNDLWMYDVTDKEWRNTQASYIPPFPASNLIFQKPPENELYRPAGLPAPPPLYPEPMAEADDDPINRPGGAQAPAGDAEPLPAEVSSPDPSAIGAPNDGAAKLPSAAELKKMQDAEAMKKKLAAQKRREKLSPAARLEAKRKRALRRKRMLALAQSRAKKAEAKRLRNLEEQWKKKWYKEFESKRDKWEKEHKHNEHVTVDLTGNKPVSVSISKPEAKLTPATDEEKQKAEAADAEGAKADEGASGGSGGSGGSDAEEPAKDESSDGNAEDAARFRQYHSAHLVDVAADGSQRVSHQRHRRMAGAGAGAHHHSMPEVGNDLFAQSEPVTHAASSAASAEAHAQWMGDFTALLELDAAYGGHGTTEPVDAMDDGLDAALAAHSHMPDAAGPNNLMRLVFRHRERSLLHRARQTPRYIRPSEAQSFFQAYESIGFGGFSGFDGFSGFGTPNPPPPPPPAASAAAAPAAPGTFAEVGAFAGAAGGAGAAAGAVAAAGAGAGAGAVAGMYGGVGAREDDADLPKGALDPDADHAVVQDQQHPKYTTPFVGDEVWEFNIDTKQWKFIPKAIRLGNAFPQPRWLHSAVVIDGKMVVFGGVNPDSVILGDVWVFDPNSHDWMNAKIEGVPILPREGHTATAVGNSMIVFGGISYAYSPFNDVWTYMSSENKWVMNKPSGPKPPPRWMHTAVLHASKSGARSIFIFGGITHQYVPLNDLWRLNIESMTWEHPQTKGHAPFPRMLHAAVIFEDDMFIHAGGANNLLHEDLWKITLTDDAMAWEEQLPSGASPFARMGHTLTGVSPPMNPTPSRDPRPAWHPPDNSVPSPKVQKPFPIRPRKEYSSNRYFYCFGGARNNC